MMLYYFTLEPTLGGDRYTYRAYLEMELNYSDDAKSTHLTAAGYTFKNDDKTDICVILYNYSKVYGLVQILRAVIMTVLMVGVHKREQPITANEPISANGS
uniref:Uncharacterized protein n=1 Tax=Romanomermis culicivorax TaxID=13658 RepID=A0A915KMI4_ROMCU